MKQITMLLIVHQGVMADMVVEGLYLKGYYNLSTIIGGIYSLWKAFI